MGESFFGSEPSAQKPRFKDAEEKAPGLGSLDTRCAMRALRDGRSVNENFEDFGLNEFSCSDEMKALLKSMLAKDPELRPTAKEIMVECEKLLCLTSPLESSML